MSEKHILTLETGRWSQRVPYNSQYPSNYYMGCVPIAVGEIMCFHKYPDSGEGILVAQGDKPEVLLNEQEYDWELIPQVLLRTDSENKIDMTSKFVMHVSRSCKIEPKPGTVGTHTDNAISSFIDNFKYDINIVKLKLHNDELCYTRKEIFDIAIEEINLGRPFFVGLPGHAIICNGYDINNEKFLCNWGWGQDDTWTTLDSKGCNPDQFIIGIRPREDELFVLNNYSSNFCGQYYNDTGMVSFSVYNKSMERECTFRVVLYDAAGVRRNIISEEVVHVFDDDNENILLPVKLPENLTFGQRNLSVEYKLKYGFRPLRNSSGNINTHSIETKKTSSTIVIKSDIMLPENIRKDDVFYVDVSIGNAVDTGYIAAALADKKLNNLYVLGISKVLPGSDSLQIICDFAEPFEERSYEFIFLYSEDTNFSDATSSLVKLNDGMDSTTVYVKNKSYDYLDNIKLTSITGIDLSVPINDYTPYQFNITTKITHLTDVSGPLCIMLTNGDDDVIQIYPQGGVLGKIVGEFDFQVGFGAQRPILSSMPMVLKIKLCVWDVANNKYYLLAPASSEVENPINTMLVHINSYSLLYLGSEIVSEYESVGINTEFNVGANLVFIPGSSNNPGKVTDIVAYAESSDGVILEIGRAVTVIILPDHPAEVNIACKFIDGASSGKYKVFLKAINDMVAPEDTPTDFISSFDNSDYYCNVTLE